MSTHKLNGRPRARAAAARTRFGRCFIDGFDRFMRSSATALTVVGVPCNLHKCGRFELHSMGIPHIRTRIREEIKHNVINTFSRGAF